MKRLVHLAALAFVATLVLAPAATAQQMMNDDRMMNDNMMASPSATASATPSPSATTSATATPTATASATATVSAARGHHRGGGGSASATVSQLPKTGGVSLVSLVSVGALALLMGSGLVAARLLRQSA